MDTIGVNIAYRPLRIGWVISSADIQAFRQAVRISHTYSGGRFNPIILADRQAEAKQLVDLFRVDVLLPIGETEEVTHFQDHYPYLINPLYQDSISIGGINESIHVQILEIRNQVSHIFDTPAFNVLREKGFRIFHWNDNDPLADVFLIQHGAYPSKEEINIDYLSFVKETLNAKEQFIAENAPIPRDTIIHPSIAYLSRHGLHPHYSVHIRPNQPGFFIGDASNIEDLVCYWNLRASHIPLYFLDSNSFSRYTEILPEWVDITNKKMASSRQSERQLAVWTRTHDVPPLPDHIKNLRTMLHHVTKHTWNGYNVEVPMMYFGENSTLGVVGWHATKHRISFPLLDKPFSNEPWFHNQHLVASISFSGRMPDHENQILVPPYIPELNEFYARNMQFDYSALRIESGRVGVIIDAADTDTFLYTLPSSQLIEEVFSIAGFATRPSPAGLITRQLISKLGGLQGGRVFKIPGVRRLLRTYGPTATFTKRSALQIIGGRDPANPSANFEDYKNLFIEPRPTNMHLDPHAVFTHLVEKGLFRLGTELNCPGCNMTSWVALDDLRHQIVCKLCGLDYDATRQLVDKEWYYRRSGVMGTEKNALGAVPVVLTLQQLDTNIRDGFSNYTYSPSLEISPIKGSAFPNCEIDFAWLLFRRFPHKVAIILGECKDQGTKIDADDIQTMRILADAFSGKKFSVFVLFSKLGSYTPEELELAERLNDEYTKRVILFTHRELEPYRLYERTVQEFQSLDTHAGRPEDFANITSKMYFGS